MKHGVESKHLHSDVDKLKGQLTWLTSALMSIGDGVIAVDAEGKICLINPGAEAITGYKNFEVIGSHIEEVFKLYDENTNQAIENPVNRAIKEGVVSQLPSSTILINKELKEIPISDSVSPVKDSEGNILGAIIVFRDETNKRCKEKKLEYLSLYDSLTGLYNRNYFEQQLNVLQEQDFTASLGVIICDIDGLKAVNDSMGHRAGDRLLKQAAAAIKECFRKEDIIARIGGDEFIILLPGCNVLTLKNLARRIQDNVIRYNQLYPDLPLSISVGFALGSQNDVSDIMIQADLNMYQDKLKRRGNPEGLLKLNFNLSRKTRICEGMKNPVLAGI